MCAMWNTENIMNRFTELWKNFRNQLEIKTLILQHFRWFLRMSLEINRYFSSIFRRSQLLFTIKLMITPRISSFLSLVVLLVSFLVYPCTPLLNVSFKKSIILSWNEFLVIDDLIDTCSILISKQRKLLLKMLFDLKIFRKR